LQSGTKNVTFNMFLMNIIRGVKDE